MKNFFKIISLPFLFYSCAIYTPTSINAPLFSEKGQAAISGTAGFGYNIQGAYAFSNHLAILGNISNYDIGQTRHSGEYIIIKGNGKFNEVAIGYFTKKPDGTYLDIYGGFGKLKTKNTLNYYGEIKEGERGIFYNPKYNINLHKYFIQPGMGWVGKNVELAFNARFALVQFQNPISQVPDSIILQKKLNQLDKNPNYLFEPAITLRFGTKYGKFQLQYLRSYNFESNKYIENTGGNLSIGLFGKFPTKRKTAPKID